jgi:hypothetical protein
MEDWPFEVNNKKNFKLSDWILGALMAILFFILILATGQ